MKITSAQIFLIGTALITFVTAVCSTLKVADPTVISQIGAAAGVLWAAVGAAFTTPGQQVQSVTKNIDQPDIKGPVVVAVSNLRGVDTIDVNNRADATLTALAKNPAFDKINETK